MNRVVAGYLRDAIWCGIGAAVGSIVTYQVVQTKNRKEMDEDLNDLREIYARRLAKAEGALAAMKADAQAEETVEAQSSLFTELPAEAVVRDPRPDPKALFESVEQAINRSELRPRNPYEEALANGHPSIPYGKLTIDENNQVVLAEDDDEEDEEPDEFDVRPEDVVTPPYLVTVTQFHQNAEEWDNFTVCKVTYYDGDDVFVTEDGDTSVDDDREEYFPENVLQSFGFGSNDTTKVYVVNEQYDTIYEITRTDGPYVE